MLKICSSVNYIVQFNSQKFHIIKLSWAEIKAPNRCIIQSGINKSTNHIQKNTLIFQKIRNIRSMRRWSSVQCNRSFGTSQHCLQRSLNCVEEIKSFTSFRCLLHCCYSIIFSDSMRIWNCGTQTLCFSRESMSCLPRAKTCSSLFTQNNSSTW